jgi:hypothetical protein
VPAPVLNAEAKLICSHGGQVIVIPKQFMVLAGGAPALLLGDLIGSPIVGCLLVPTPVTSPCINIVSEIPIPGVGMAPMAMSDGRPLLLEGIMGITDSVPPGTFEVVFPGQTMVMA